MTYEESSQLMTDPHFRGRIKVACLKFGTYIIDEPTTVPAHSTRVRWAQNTAINPDQTAMQIQPMVVMDPAVQAAWPTVSDAQVQAAVEAVINKML